MICMFLVKVMAGFMYLIYHGKFINITMMQFWMRSWRPSIWKVSWLETELQTGISMFHQVSLKLLIISTWFQNVCSILTKKITALNISMISDHGTVQTNAKTSWRVSPTSHKISTGMIFTDINTQMVLAYKLTQMRDMAPPMLTEKKSHIREATPTLSTPHG